MAAKKNGPAKASASLAPKRRGRPRKAAEKPVEEQEDQELDEEEIAPAPKSKTAPRSPKKPVVPVSSNSEHENGNGKADDEEDDDVDEAPQKKSSSKTKATKGKAKATPMPKSKRTANSAGSSTSKRAKKAETGDDDETEEYEVEKILDIKNMKGGKREFLIKWKGWGMDQTTWEPEEHLQCKELLDAFISKIDAANLSRPRRVRKSTVQNSLATKHFQNVKGGRIIKSKSTSRKPPPMKTLIEEAKKINGELNKAKVEPQPMKEAPTQASITTSYQNHNGFGLTTAGRTWRRGALLSGFVLSVGAAVLLSSSSTISWAAVSQPALQIINRLREQIHNKWAAS